MGKQKNMKSSIRTILLVLVFVYSALEYSEGFNSKDFCRKTKKRCQGAYGFQCTHDFCTKGTDCEVLYSRLMSNPFIQRCPYLFDYSDISTVCRSGITCFLKHKQWFSHSIQLLPIVCPCPKDFSFVCGSDYCTVNEEICKAYKAIKTKISIKSCQNENLTINSATLLSRTLF